MSTPFFIPLSFKDAVNHAVEWLVGQYGDQFRQLSGLLLRGVLLPLESVLRAAPPWLVLLAVALLAWHASRSAGRSLGLAALLYLIGCFGLWDALMQTLAIMLVALALALAIGIPLGIAAAWSDRLRRVLLPVLDVMQTLPSFVYLVPVLMLFGLGKVPAILATVVYALPPLVRLTDLGIRQVDPGLTEAAWSFGTTRWQLLLTVQLPQARPTIMAGINQATMMALAMVVIASMIGARGLGEDVLAGIQTLDVGRGMQAGLAIVILAIVADRIGQAYGRPRARRTAEPRR
ncbi:ABC transporter permease [Chitinimonas koreensis]|uniref:ABC transporter permease n=1 Tax=Chitinimonas koreensis TaxID=356302 RepID=UPI000419265A|nr:ABC transporter permease subunit [Chitinimonas koreensis]QNM96048.1 ABC transporter permease subunit [Chitinimonas koreensis]